MTPSAWARMIVLGLLLALTVQPARPCSILALHDGDTVLMGNNEDYVEPGYVWFAPARHGRHGRVNVGFANGFVQGSMNDQGLSFDAAVVPKVDWSAAPELPTPKNLIEMIMDECATVEQAIDYFRRHNCRHLDRSQFLFADATGDAAVIAWLPSTGLSIERMDGRQLIATNHRLAPSGYRCARHVRAQQVLAQREETSLETVRAVLEAIHQHGPDAYTSYSTVYDLKARRVTIYNLAHFGEAVQFDLTAELARSRRKRRRLALADLFEQRTDPAVLTSLPQRSDFGTGIRLSAEDLDRFAGVYSPTVAPEVRVRVLREGRALRVENPGQPPARLMPESATTFRITPDRGLVSFRVGSDGAVEGLTLHKQVDIFAPRVGDL